MTEFEGSDVFRPVILYEDNHVLAVRKVPGMLSQEDHTGDPDLLSELKEFLRVRDRKPGQAWLGLVHRLDRPTGGVMVFAKTSKAASRLSESIRKRQIRKEYLVLCDGALGRPGDRRTFEDVLSKDPHANHSRVLRPGTSAADGHRKERSARLELQVLAVDASAQCSLAAVSLITGRSHQIRVQFAERGFPLAGDRKYGREKPGDSAELGLWAYRLDIPHPTTKEMLTFMDWPEHRMWETLLTSQLRETLEKDG